MQSLADLFVRIINILLCTYCCMFFVEYFFEKISNKICRFVLFLLLLFLCTLPSIFYVEITLVLAGAIYRLIHTENAKQSVLGLITTSVLIYTGFIGILCFCYIFHFKANPFFKLFGDTIINLFFFYCVMGYKTYCILRKHGKGLLLITIFELSIFPITVFVLIQIHNASIFLNQNFNTILLLILFINVVILAMQDKMIAYYDLNLISKNIELEKNLYEKRCIEAYKLMEEKSKFYHDMKNHLSVISSLNDQHKSDELTDYIDSLSAKMKTTDYLVKTGNIILDCTLDEKLQLLRTLETKTELNVDILYDISLAPMEITALFGNLLDNAYEALKKCPENNRYFCLDIVGKKGLLLINVRNTYMKKDFCERGTSKDDKNNHGYGLRIIKSIVDKYEGILVVDRGEEMFNVNIKMMV